jgi:hypothetical protein
MRLKDMRLKDTRLKDMCHLEDTCQAGMTDWHMSEAELEKDLENRMSGYRKFDRYPLRVGRRFDLGKLSSTVP